MARGRDGDTTHRSPSSELERHGPRGGHFTPVVRPRHPKWDYTRTESSRRRGDSMTVSSLEGTRSVDLGVSLVPDGRSFVEDGRPVRLFRVVKGKGPALDA